MNGHGMLDAMGNINLEYVQDSERVQTIKRRTRFGNLSRVAVAAIGLCACLTGVSVLAATGTLKGIFKDVFGWDGAVVGTVYESVGNEITANVVAGSDSMDVSIVFTDPTVVPFSEMEKLGIGKYVIQNSDGETVKSGDSTELTDIYDGITIISISGIELEKGDYRLVITELVGGKKADQNLSITGNWECDFSIK